MFITRHTQYGTVYATSTDNQAYTLSFVAYTNHDSSPVDVLETDVPVADVHEAINDWVDHMEAIAERYS